MAKGAGKKKLRRQLANAMVHTNHSTQHAGRLESALERVANLRDIGRMAVGTAREVRRNLLIANTLLKRALADEAAPLPEHQRNAVNLALAESTKALSNVETLLAFRRQRIIAPDRLKTDAIDLNKVLRGLEAPLHRLSGSRTSITIGSVAANLPEVLGNRRQMESIVLDLAAHARRTAKAHTEGHTLIVISTKRVTLKRRQRLNLVQASPGDYALLTIQITGIILPEKEITSFFAASWTADDDLTWRHDLRRTLEALGGGMEIVTQRGRDTSIRIYLPFWSEDAYVPQPAAPSKSYRGGTERILIVDDDEEIPWEAANALTGLGYTVYECTDPRQALHMLRVLMPDVDLLITDDRMPGLTGMELATEARRDYPELPVLFISGYWDASNTLPSMSIRQELLLSKPFDLADLDEAVRLALERRTDTGNPRILPPIPSEAPPES
ncbi:MAG: response regulator [Anaerolineae bacterium]|nr:response regulator [Anaerolineae bacterium]